MRWVYDEKGRELWMVVDLRKDIGNVIIPSLPCCCFSIQPALTSCCIIKYSIKVVYATIGEYAGRVGYTNHKGHDYRLEAIPR